MVVYRKKRRWGNQQARVAATEEENINNRGTRKDCRVPGGHVTRQTEVHVPGLVDGSPLGGAGQERKKGQDKQVLILEEAQRPSVNSAEKVEWREIEITFDSGATDPVMPLRMCEDISIKPSPQSERGTEYEVANGEVIPNVGERRCVVMTEHSDVPKLMNFQVCDVQKPLLSATKVCDMGYRCILDGHNC